MLIKRAVAGVPKISRLVWWIIGVPVILIALFALTLAMPVPAWRTGRTPVPPLALEPGGPPIAMADRFWIDTDAACGVGSRADPDDCFALALLLMQRPEQIVGISTVFGNAKLTVTHERTRMLVAAMQRHGAEPTAVHIGSAEPGDKDAPAHEALRTALAQGPLTIVGLGPLTNVAEALADRPDLQANVTRLVAVMSQRPGHIFHPSEGEGGGVLLGHGPVFRDFNFVKDPVAAASVLSMQLPMTLIPYDVARHVVLTGADLDRIGRNGPALSWVAEQARAWLAYWKQDIGVNGFYPFDLLAAGYVLQPDKFNCIKTRASAGVDRTLWTSWFWTTHALMIEAGDDGAPVIYCPDAARDLKGWLVRQLAGDAPQAARTSTR